MVRGVIVDSQRISRTLLNASFPLLQVLLNSLNFLLKRSGRAGQLRRFFRVLGACELNLLAQVLRSFLQRLHRLLRLLDLIDRSFHVVNQP